VVDPEGSGWSALARPAVPRGTAEAGGFGAVREAERIRQAKRPSGRLFQRRANRRSARLKARTNARAGGFANRCRRLGSAPGNRLRVMQLSDSG
jgi:hypothetical protein